MNHGSNRYNIVIRFQLVLSLTSIFYCTSLGQSPAGWHPAGEMVELKSIIPTLLLDLRYAGKNNFMGKRLYPRNLSYTFLRKPPALALLELSKKLQEEGLVVKIFDAYRPYSVTKKMWNLVRDERYVANPAKGSGHNRGIAVDLTLVDSRTGKELPMGTGFDNFTDSAHQGFQGLDSTELHNRKKLRSIMESHGFRALETEWWHYFWPESDRFEVLDLSFRQLKKMTATR